jgi:hypothetical protein
MMLLAVMLGASFFSHAQNYEDVLRYSQKYYQGTARSFGMANAIGALGGDFTAIGINPASTGLYRRPEFTISADLNHQHSTAAYLANVSHDERYNLAISNLGLVVADVKTDDNGKPLKKGWISVNYALGFNRTNNFSGHVDMEGTNTQNSVLNAYAQQANTAGYNGGGAYPSQLDPYSFAYMAWYTNLIQLPNSNDSSHYTEVFNNPNFYDKNFKKVYQTDRILTTGAMNDITFSIGGNYSNRIYLGANILVPTVGYHYERDFTELNTSDSAVAYRSAQQKELLHTSGVGISAAFGVIYRFTDNFRGGLAVQVPTFYALHDQYSYELDAYYVGAYSQYDATYKTEDAFFSYKIITPARFTVSGAYLFGKQGLISADYELANYGSGRINTNYEGDLAKNNAIQQVLATGNNFRIGGEYRTGALSLRAGFAAYGPGYKSSLAPSGYGDWARILSLGAGLRSEDYFLDFGYQNQLTSYFHLPYALAHQDVSGATIKDDRGSFIVTLGSRF